MEKLIIGDELGQALSQELNLPFISIENRVFADGEIQPRLEKEEKTQEAILIIQKKQEENINAANKGAYQTARDYQLSNLGTMAGEMGRDKRLTDANEKYNERYFETMKDIYPGQTLNEDRTGWINTGTGLNVNMDHSSIFPNRTESWRYGPQSSIYPQAEMGEGINTSFNQVNRGMRNNPYYNRRADLFTPVNKWRNY